MPHSWSARLLQWYDRAGRKNLPWQQRTDAYAIWVAETMLQQTQVATVIPYFERFIAHLPDLKTLATADQDQVLHLWSGLGFYARARNLQAAAKQIMAEHNGVFPQDQRALEALPGIGRSTAGAIRVQAFAQRAPILDGNVKRVLTRFYGITEWPGTRKIETQLWAKATALLPHKRLRDYTQAVMDLGALLCTRSRPHCAACPLATDCIAKRDSLQAQIPARKPKPTKPVRDIVFLILRNPAGEVLLHRRPPTGVWGGLWSFPELAADRLQEDLAEHTPQPISKLDWLPAGTHEFSHFRLRYRPLLVRLAETDAPATGEPGGHIWYSHTLSPPLGLPAPVAKILQQIQAPPHG